MNFKKKKIYTDVFSNCKIYLHSYIRVTVHELRDSGIYSICSEDFFIFTQLQICNTKNVANSDICKQVYKPLKHIVSMSHSIVSCLTGLLLLLVRSAHFLLLVTVVKIKENINIYHEIRIWICSCNGCNKYEAFVYYL